MLCQLLHSSSLRLLPQGCTGVAILCRLLKLRRGSGSSSANACKLIGIQQFCSPPVCLKPKPGFKLVCVCWSYPGVTMFAYCPNISTPSSSLSRPSSPPRPKHPSLQRPCVEIYKCVPCYCGFDASVTTQTSSLLQCRDTAHCRSDLALDGSPQSHAESCHLHLR